MVVSYSCVFKAGSHDPILGSDFLSDIVSAYRNVDSRQ